MDQNTSSSDHAASDAGSPPGAAKPLVDLPAREITALARRWQKANGPLMSGLNRVGSTIEARLALIPSGLRKGLEATIARSLETAYGLAARGARLPGASSTTGTFAAAMATGAAGGVGGMATVLAEMPVTVTVILHAIRREAAAQGYDPDDPWIMAECLRTFSSGSPTGQDDGIDTSFFSTRMALTGPALSQLIAHVAPKIAATLSQKLALAAVPVLGAVSGAALNAAFLSYYREMAAIRFALLRLSEEHGATPVLEAFESATRQRRLPRA